MLRPPQRNHGNGDSERNTGLRGRDKWFNGMHAPTPATHALVDADLYGTLKEKHTRLSPTQLCAMYDDVRDRTLRALGSLEDIQMHGEVNPMIVAQPDDLGARPQRALLRDNGRAASVSGAKDSHAGLAA